MKDSLFYKSLFKVSDKDLETVAGEAAKGGADYVDLYFERTVFREIMLRDGKVSTGGFHVDYGVGIRVIKGNHTGYSYCETTDVGEMTRAARIAGSISACASGAGKSILSAGRNLSSGDYYPVLRQWSDADAERLSAFLKTLESMLYERDGRINKVIARISSSDSDVMMYNSFGETVCDSRPMGNVAVSIIFSDGKTTDNRSVSRSFRKGFEILDGSLASGMVEDLVSGIDNCLAAGRPRGGRMSVVMGAGASGILLHEAMGHAFEADFNRKGQSVFCDKMGKRICREGIDIVDDGTLTGNRGACNWDDEGIPGQKTYMVKDGVLNSYLHDRISAAHYGVQPTGNGRRESFRFCPIPRMRLTYMENGEAEPSDIIASVKKGIYVNEFSNGQVKIGEGDFTFYVKSGFLIENGHLTAPVKDINIIGNGPEALADIVAVGNDLKIDDSTWTCGKDQSVPVGCGMPTVMVKELTVGGE